MKIVVTLPKFWLTCTGIHGVVSQKMKLLKTTAVRMSDPTPMKIFRYHMQDICLLSLQAVRGQLFMEYGSTGDYPVLTNLGCKEKRLIQFVRTAR
jgi:hypothetical protein